MERRRHAGLRTFPMRRTAGPAIIVMLILAGCASPPARHARAPGAHAPQSHVSLDPAQRNNVVLTALSMVDTPYHYGGREFAGRRIRLQRARIVRVRRCHTTRPPSPGGKHRAHQPVHTAHAAGGRRSCFLQHPEQTLLAHGYLHRRWSVRKCPLFRRARTCGFLIQPLLRAPF